MTFFTLRATDGSRLRTLQKPSHGINASTRTNRQAVLLSRRKRPPIAGCFANQTRVSRGNARLVHGPPADLLLANDGMIAPAATMISPLHFRPGIDDAPAHGVPRTGRSPLPMPRGGPIRLISWSDAFPSLKRGGGLPPGSSVIRRREPGCSCPRWRAQGTNGLRPGYFLTAMLSS